MRRGLVGVAVCLCVLWAGVSLRSQAGMNRVAGIALSAPNGVPVPGATVTVFIAGTGTTIPLYAKADGSQVLTNPFTVGANAYWDFYTPAQRVDVQFSGTGVLTPYTLGDVLTLPQVPTSTLGTLPVASAFNKGSMVLVTDQTRGMYYSTGTAWVPTGIGGIADTLNRNTIVGLSAGPSLTGGATENTVLGAFAGQNLTSGGPNTIIGPYAGRALTTETGNTFIGNRAGLLDTGTTANVFIGEATGQANTTGDFNTFVGRNGAQNTTGNHNTFIGYTAGALNTDGANNTCVGTNACTSNTSGFSLTMVGINAGENLTTGSSNTFVGTQTGTAETTSSYNTYMGSFSAQIETGQANAYYGYKSGWMSTAGNRNTYLGNSAAFNYTISSDNTIVGYDAGHAGTGTGSGANTLIGSLATTTANGTNQATAVGYAAVSIDQGAALGYAANAAASGCAAIGANSHCTVANSVVLGNPAGGSLVQVGIGTASPDVNALLDLTSQTAYPKALLLPRLSTVQMNAMPVGSNYGYVIYNLNMNKVCYYNSSAWVCP